MSDKSRQVALNRAHNTNDDVRPIILAIVVLIISYYKFVHDIWVTTPFVVGVMLLAYFSLVPRAMRPIANGLIFVANRLGKFNNVLVLSFLFFVILTPVGFVIRSLKGDRLDLKPRKSPLEDYFKTRPAKGKDIDFKKMY